MLQKGSVWTKRTRDFCHGHFLKNYRELARPMLTGHKTYEFWNAWLPFPSAESTVSLVHTPDGSRAPPCLSSWNGSHQSPGSGLPHWAVTPAAELEAQESGEQHNWRSVVPLGRLHVQTRKWWLDSWVPNRHCCQNNVHQSLSEFSMQRVNSSAPSVNLPLLSLLPLPSPAGSSPTLLPSLPSSPSFHYLPFASSSPTALSPLHSSPCQFIPNSPLSTPSTLHLLHLTFCAQRDSRDTS